MSWETTADVGASPYPPSGEIMVQGEIDPPKRTKKFESTLDYVILPRCPVFTTESTQGAMTHSSRYRTGAKQRRLGNVPKIWANFYQRGMSVNDENGGVLTSEDVEKIRFVGVSVDGQLNGKDAKDFPESAGRLAVMVQGSVSMTIDERYLTNPTFGDYLEWLPDDSGLRITGTKHYGLPIIRNVKPQDVDTGRESWKEELFPFDTIEIAKASLQRQYKGHKKENIIGMYLEHTPGQNEVRVLLRPFAPLKPT